MKRDAFIRQLGFGHEVIAGNGGASEAIQLAHGCGKANSAYGLRNGGLVIRCKNLHQREHGFVRCSSSWNTKVVCRKHSCQSKLSSRHSHAAA